MSSAIAQTDREALLARYAAWEAEGAEIAKASHDSLSLPDLLGLATRRERMQRAQGAVDNSIVAGIVQQATPAALGGATVRETLAERLRISPTEATRRIAESKDLGPRRGLTGEPLQPLMPATAAAVARGDIGGEHVKVIRKFFSHLPKWVDACTRDQAEVTLARAASTLGPDALQHAADRLALLLDQDGEEPSDAERARRRFLTFGKQESDGTSEVRGRVDAETRATWEAINAKWAAPGMCNPSDETACVDDKPDQETVDRDTRTAGQRQHDAFNAVGRAMLASGMLGQHNGLPCTIVVSTTLAEIESGKGWAVTGGGSMLPMADVIRIASHAYHYLCVYHSHSEVPLYLGRTKRIASPGQRIVLYDKERGCTRPGCTAPAYWSEVHHAQKDWIVGGQTNIDELTLACRRDHRMLTNKGWKTQKGKDGRTEWIPPPHLDSGQARVNDYHHPLRYLAEPDDP
ncbi:HNH endonuclease [Mycobacterium sp. 21AC1]|uniref:HNH endonuclease signature motif containing protein n=1 Tax=[Mycobacterium] appelbergii TaxID=2939269 RepID=UPI002939070A|nr:HNH endonuclease signature motif containing protein [Mycobacterium sp. 21AC1]MDV3128958.1 HNH endonuclease [Mycobacterium sp. 21AC1]